MIRHVVLLRWKDGVGPDHVQATVAALERLPAMIPELIAYHCGPDIGVVDANCDFAIAALFDSVEDYLVYDQHPEHRAVVKTLVAPHIIERHAVQFSED